MTLKTFFLIIILKTQKHKSKSWSLVGKGTWRKGLLEGKIELVMKKGRGGSEVRLKNLAQLQTLERGQHG